MTKAWQVAKGGGSHVSLRGRNDFHVQIFHSSFPATGSASVTKGKRIAKRQ